MVGELGPFDPIRIEADDNRWDSRCSLRFGPVLSPTHDELVETPWGDLRVLFAQQGIYSAYFADSRAPRGLREPPGLIVNRRGQTWDLARLFEQVDVLCWGTPFQRLVWATLVTLPAGVTCTYGALAQRLGRPSAVRAVANAVANNPVGLLIPCHRVLPASRGVGSYRWGAERKAAILHWELHCH
ncbi:MAG TPA: hypothetical protein DCQ06_04510 [Myxococcales bacterium]|nr:hypothetical protein [Myxococcales bacterium]